MYFTAMRNSPSRGPDCRFRVKPKRPPPPSPSGKSNGEDAGPGSKKRHRSGNAKFGAGTSETPPRGVLGFFAGVVRRPERWCEKTQASVRIEVDRRDSRHERQRHNALHGVRAERGEGCSNIRRATTCGQAPARRRTNQRQASALPRRWRNGRTRANFFPGAAVNQSSRSVHRGDSCVRMGRRDVVQAGLERGRPATSFARMTSVAGQNRKYVASAVTDSADGPSGDSVTFRARCQVDGRDNTGHIGVGDRFQQLPRADAGHQVAPDATGREKLAISAEQVAQGSVWAPTSAPQDCAKALARGKNGVQRRLGSTGSMRWRYQRCEARFSGAVTPQPSVERGHQCGLFLFFLVDSSVPSPRAAL